MANLIVVRILLNEYERGSFVRGYAPGDPLVQVYEGEHRLPYHEFAEVSLEFIFEENQWVSEARRPWYDGARSISVGDVIVLHDRAYAVAKGVGFTEIDPVEAGIEELVA